MPTHLARTSFSFIPQKLPRIRGTVTARAELSHKTIGGRPPLDPIKN